MVRWLVGVSWGGWWCGWCVCEGWWVVVLGWVSFGVVGGWWYFGFLDLYNPCMVPPHYGHDGWVDVVVMGGWAWVGWCGHDWQVGVMGGGIGWSGVRWVV